MGIIDEPVGIYECVKDINHLRTGKRYITGGKLYTMKTDNYYYTSTTNDLGGRHTFDEAFFKDHFKRQTRIYLCIKRLPDVPSQRLSLNYVYPGVLLGLQEGYVQLKDNFGMPFFCNKEFIDEYFTTSFNYEKTKEKDTIRKHRRGVRFRK